MLIFISKPGKIMWIETEDCHIDIFIFLAYCIGIAHLPSDANLMLDASFLTCSKEQNSMRSIVFNFWSNWWVYVYLVLQVVVMVLSWQQSHLSRFKFFLLYAIPAKTTEWIAVGSLLSYTPGLMKILVIFCCLFIIVN